MTKNSQLGFASASPAEKLIAARLPAPPIRRKIREDAGHTVPEVAAAIGVTGRTLERWENGDCWPQFRHRVAYGLLLADLAARPVALAA